MLKTGVQTRNVINDEMPKVGFGLLKIAGFSCVDFSLNGYLTNSTLYRNEKNLLTGRIRSWKSFSGATKMRQRKLALQSTRCICLIRCMFRAAAGS